jgi:hypothetical protein
MADKTKSNEQYQQLLAQQLAMNEQTWTTLARNGLKPDAEVQLDFSYYGPNEERVNALKDFLQAETDYTANVAEGDGRWALTGRTQKTRVSKEILDQWVDWMIIAGLRYGCQFDGWGTEVP